MEQRPKDNAPPPLTAALTPPPLTAALTPPPLTAALTPPPLTAAMASRRLRVLDFVRAYITRWGGSPSLGEIAAGVGIHRDAAWKAVRSLARAGVLLHTPGTRGLALPDGEAEAVRQLRAMGWVVDTAAASATKGTLPPPIELDYPGSNSGSGGGYGGTADGADDARGDSI